MFNLMPSIARHKTAIRRGRLSRPLRMALDDRVVSPERAVFDYGCGHGEDIALLQADGYAASGWDPALRPNGVRAPADVVNLGYVLNVIEHPAERADVLRAAWSLTRDVLVVAARLTNELPDVIETEFADGQLTRLGTFQKYYTQSELRSVIDETLLQPSVAAAPGVFYVFRDETRREAFLAQRYRRAARVPHVSLLSRLLAEHQALFDALAGFLAERGRLPEVNELPEGPALVEAVGSIRRAYGLVRRATGDAPWEQVRADRTQDLLVYLALSKFTRRPQWTAIPIELQLDIKGFFRTYAKARVLADELLFSAGQMNTISTACAASPVGKVMPQALYVHVSGVPLLPPVLRVYVGCAQVLTGIVEDATILKLNRIDPKVSFLAYPSFDQDAHPALSTSLRAHLRTWDLRTKDFRESANPPILHRKELFCPRDYPGRDEFARLTAQEEAVGLLNDPSIGTRNGWLAQLQRYGVTISGHDLAQG